MAALPFVNPEGPDKAYLLSASHISTLLPIWHFQFVIVACFHPGQTEL